MPGHIESAAAHDIFLQMKLAQEEKNVNFYRRRMKKMNFAHTNDAESSGSIDPLLVATLCKTHHTNNAEDPTLVTAIHDAAKVGNAELVEKLAQKLGHGRVDVRDEGGGTPLHRASFNGSTSVVQILLKYGANVNARDKLNRTPLHRARTHTVALLLLDHGADVNALDSCNYSPLFYAICSQYRDLALVPLLLERGAVMDQMGDGETPLFLASKENRFEHARLFISYKADVNVVFEGKSPLSVAAERGHLNMVKLLVENGANVNQFEFNQSPLYLAIENNHRDVAKVLSQFGYSMQFQAKIQSLLSVSAEIGDLYKVKLLVESGANVNQFEYTQSPLYLAIQKNHMHVAKYLIQKNAYFSIIDPKMSELATKFGGETCYHLGIQMSDSTSPNYIMAGYWYSFAAELGYAAAYSPFALMLLEGRGITRSLSNAEKWFLHAEKWFRHAEKRTYQVDAQHCFILGEAFLTGKHGVVCDYDKAFYWLKRAAEPETGSNTGRQSPCQATVAKLELGKLYLYGKGTSINVDEAERLLGSVVDEVHASVCYAMGHVLNVSGTDPNYEKVFFWLKRAVDQSGLPTDQLNIAKYELGKLYLHGNGTTKDIVEADRLLQGLSTVDAITSFTIGHAFLSQDQHQNYTKAFDWLKKALEVKPALPPNNLNSTRLELGRLYLHGNGTERNLAAADKLFRQVNVVDLSSICTIGVAFCQDNASQNYEKAFHWLTKAAQDEANLPLDQSNALKFELGKLYLHGNGTSCNIVAADKWLCKVTTAIDSQTCHTIGHKFYVPGEHQNYKKAFHWLKKASEAADECVEAWMKLGILYIEGQGVNSNLKAGKAWLQKFANATGSISYKTSDRVTLTFPKDYITNTVNTSPSSEGPYISQSFAALFHGNETYCDIIAADEKLPDVATTIDSQSCYTIGQAFYVCGGQQNHKKAFHWLKKASEAADECVEAWMKLGILYIEGQGVNANVKEGKAWLQKVANVIGSLSYKTSDGVTLTFPKDYVGIETDSAHTLASEGPTIPETFASQSNGPSIPGTFDAILHGPSIPGSFQTDSEAGTEGTNGD
ncbi:Ankyrin repeat domain-containing protein 16 [Rhizoclosmatium sp. JEL0117]|nr:Ankyrin repeat domain-containing protein 16 [Rhizoclosmatium sp. JEL0117]